MIDVDKTNVAAGELAALARRTSRGMAYRFHRSPGSPAPSGRVYRCVFNPLFPRGAYFGPKLTMFGPFNIMDAHPVLMFSPLPNISCALDAAWFWRESLEDGLYQIGGALIRPSGGSRARYIGSQINFELRWALDLHTTIAVNLAGFFTGGFLKDTGPAENVAFSNIGITYRF